MKKIVAMLLVVVLLFAFIACDNTASKGSEETFVEIKESPDKYTWYIKNYVGRNCASFGDVYYDEYRYEEYGEGRVKFVFIADDNSFVDPADKDSLKNYVVTAQSVAPNTELKYVFAKWSDESESSVVEKQNIEEIELYVKRMTDNSEKEE